MTSQDPGLPQPGTAPSAETVVHVYTTTLWDFVESLRPAQWVKNGFVFAALIFSRNLSDWHAVTLVVAAVLVFCAASSAAYLLNDVLDAAEDRKHPLKRLRPVAAGRVTPRAAVWASLVLVVTALFTAWELDRRFFIVIACYVVLNGLYSSVLKHVALVDVFVVAAGFVLRVLGGGAVIRVQLSAWLIVCTTLLALFLALSKRRHEMVLLGEGAAEHRPNLVDYSPYFLDQLIAIVTASTVMSYALYTLSPDVHTKFPGKHLELTVPFVLFGIFRYLYLVHQREGGGNPTRLLLTDRVLLAVVLMWAASVILIIYL
ncbi:MAG TPA: decaprenyl-phosphate phosphoribosyltransferase [Terriglobia bacterium]|nr:decaprenyl-phosphate phosphoribosyltransferase [Terriglobia bacterium]